MVEVCKEASRVCKGLVAFVIEGQTRNFRWSAVPVLLQADLHRAGFHLRHPICYRKSSAIPGGGGRASQHAAAGGSADWLRNDWEFIICLTRGGALPWADALACGAPPKFGPGGDMTNRLTDGRRRRQHGKGGKLSCSKLVDAEGNERVAPQGIEYGKKTRRKADGVRLRDGLYAPPKIANPGNIIHCKVGGGLIGNELAHENEAPFPETLAAFFVKSFCPPNGIVCDPFAGSGTALAVALQYGRRAIGCDIRDSQVDLTRRRIAETTLQFV